MDRLTSPAEGYCETYCNDYIMPECDPEKCAHKHDVAMYEALKSIEGIVPFDRIHELARADREGRCVVLPCKVGDTVWANISIKGDRYRNSDRPYPVEVVFIGIGGGNSYFHVQYSNGRVFPFDFDQIGKTVFLTREEAEEALKAQKETGHEL